MACQCCEFSVIPRSGQEEHSHRQHGKFLFQNVKIFDGVNETLLEGKDVLISDPKIAHIVPTGSQDFGLGPTDILLGETSDQVFMLGLMNDFQRFSDGLTCLRVMLFA